jgi:anhydro-N-acetylmuramic acid kinase
MLVIGLMSGTSADGIEVALARLEEKKEERGGVYRELVGHATVPMAKAVRAEVLRIGEGAWVTAGELSQLNFRLGEEFAAAVLKACKKFAVKPEQVDLIGSHGQTVFHQGKPVPFLGHKTVSTLQIGEPAVIAARTGITTIGDFRVADVAVGGQGAPLVPFADWVLFGDEKVGRVLLNLGGIANITVIPAGGSSAQVSAFDTGPANMVMDALVTRFTKGRKTFDAEARMALRGQCVTGILKELLKDPYLKVRPPKSTGREYYGREYVDRAVKLGKKYRARPGDLVRTATIFTALSIVDALNRFVLPKVDIGEVLVSGGGAKNPLLMAQLAAALAPLKVRTLSELGVVPEAKEAYAFALLAYETWMRRPGNVPSATGARRPVILGKICWA